MGPLGKVGTHDRPLEIRAQKYVSDVTVVEGGTQYQPETPRLGQDEAAILDRTFQGLPGPGLTFLTRHLGPLILPHAATSVSLLSPSPSLPFRSCFIAECCPTLHPLLRLTCSRIFPDFRLSFLTAPRPGQSLLPCGSSWPSSRSAFLTSRTSLDMPTCLDMLGLLHI